MKKRVIFASCLTPVLTLLCAAPYLYVFVKSFLGGSGFTLEGYYRVFLAETQYLARFWKSLALTLVIAAGQLTVSTLAGFGFAKCSFPGKNGIFFLLMILMIMPLQVTLVPNYLMLDKMELLNTYYALALPMIFVPLGTFIMTRSFQSVPREVIEAARLDGCGTLGVICRIAVPMNKSGIVCTMPLSFLDGWNMVEQPIVYLKDYGMYPFSVGLASIPPADSVIQMVCCVLAALPPLFLFTYNNRELVEGITIGGEK